MQLKASAKLPIDMHQAHLWFIFPDKVADAGVLSSFYEILSDEEQLQQQRFVFEYDRHRYLVAHAFVRLCLSRYADVKPDQWVFQKNRYGKPHTDYRVNGLPLRFNLSHTNGLIACIVTVGHEVGVDVERIAWNESRMGIAERYFSPEEYDDIASLPLDYRNKRFYNYWTLKEAYIKARGFGLSMPLDTFFFRFDDNAPARISFRDTVHDYPHRWNFYLHELERKYMCAVAIECGDVPVKLVMKENVL
jgi:4'-phosphopantetheinyl transferase